ncbi:protein ligase [Ceratobasidium sp. AG-Ba]|nr:protein ligase [Ceratobasidium sp. AG-Ba]
MAQNAPDFFSRFGAASTPPTRSHSSDSRPKPRRKSSRAVLIESKPASMSTPTPTPAPTATAAATVPPTRRPSEASASNLYEPSRPAPRPPVRSSSVNALRRLGSKNASTSSISVNAGSSASSRPTPAQSRPLSPRQMGKQPAKPAPLPLSRHPSNPLPTPPKAVPVQPSSSSTRTAPPPIPPPPPVPPATSPPTQTTAAPPIQPPTSPPVQKSASDTTPRNWNPYRPTSPDAQRHHRIARRPSMNVPSTSAPPVQAPVTQQQPQPARPRSSDEITSNIARLILTPPHTQRMVTYPGTSQYSAGAPSACGLTSLNAVRCALQLEQVIRAGGVVGTGAVGAVMLGSMTKVEFVRDVMGIAPHWRSEDHLEVEDVLGLPMFERSLTKSSTAGLIITRPPEIISVLHFPASLPTPAPATFSQSQATPPAPQHIFAIFDSHPRPAHPTGSAFIVSASIDQTARYLEKLFAVDPDVVQDGGALLAAFDAHFVVAGEAPPGRTVAGVAGLHIATTDPDVYAANMGMLHAQLEARALRVQARREVEAVLEQLRQSEAAYLRERRLRETREGKVRDLEARVRELETRERDRERRRARKRAQRGHDQEREAVEEGKDPLAVLTPDEKGSLFGEEKEEKDKEPPAEEKQELEIKEEKQDEGVKESNENAEKTSSPTTEPTPQRSSTGISWNVLSSLPSRVIPFWSSSPSSVPAVDPVTVPTPISPKPPPAPVPEDAISAPELTFHCDICQDTEPEVDVAIVDACGHRFGRDCLKGFISSRLADGKFPILCPTCAAEGNSGGELGIVSSWLAESVGITEEEFQRWTQFELAAYSFELECTQCERRYMVSRDDYMDPSTKEFRCAMPDCDHVWCKSCSTTIEKGKTHTCDGSAELTRLMETEGWKACPGCKTPIEKSEGCNHMTCTTPACNTHFCYVCGGLVIQSVVRAEINEAIMQHFSNCKLFDVPDEE